MMTQVVPLSPRTGGRQPGSRPRRRPKGLRMPVGLFQYLVLCAVRRLEQLAFVPEITDDLLATYGLELDDAQTYVTAKKLSGIGLLDEEMVPNPTSNARSVKLYRLTEKGVVAVKATAAILQAVVTAEGRNPDAKTPKSGKSRTRTRARS